MNRHYGVICNGCTNENFAGKRYKCLICYDYDLCHYCKDAGTCNINHAQDHPMQCILAKCYYYNEDEDVVDLKISQPLTCPTCGEVGFTVASLKSHVIGTHSSSDDRNNKPVLCPICVMNLEANPNTFITDFGGHLKTVHSPDGRLLRENNNQMVRRDPVADLLSQLAGNEVMTNNTPPEPSPFQSIHLVVERAAPRPQAISSSSSWLPSPSTVTGWSIQPPSILKKPPSRQRITPPLLKAGGGAVLSKTIPPITDPKKTVTEKESSTSNMFLLPNYLSSSHKAIPHHVKKRHIEYKKGLVHSMVFIDHERDRLEKFFNEMEDKAKSYPQDECKIM